MAAIARASLAGSWMRVDLSLRLPAFGPERQQLPQTIFNFSKIDGRQCLSKDFLMVAPHPHPYVCVPYKPNLDRIGNYNLNIATYQLTTLTDAKYHCYNQQYCSKAPNRYVNYFLKHRLFVAGRKQLDRLADLYHLHQVLIKFPNRILPKFQGTHFSDTASCFSASFYPGSDPN